MKLKYFLIGTLTSFTLILFILYMGYKSVEDWRDKQIKEEMSLVKNDLDIKIFKFDEGIKDKLSLINISDGKQVIINNRFLFLNFWATTCAPCIAEIPSLVALSKDIEINSLPISFILVDYEKEERQKSFVEKHKYNMIFCKPKDSLPSVFNHSFIPFTYIIDFNKNIGYKIEGSQNWNDELIKTFLVSLE